MKYDARKIAFLAVTAALAEVFLYISAVLPSGRLAFVAIAGLFIAAAVVEAGPGAAASAFAVSALLGLMIVPAKSSVLLYAAFLGYYPILKSLIERLNKLALEWVLKLLVFNAALTALYFLVRELVTAYMPSFPYAALVLYVAGSAVFAVYDLGFTKLISLYIKYSKRFRPYGK